MRKHPNIFHNLWLFILSMCMTSVPLFHVLEEGETDTSSFEQVAVTADPSDCNISQPRYEHGLGEHK